MVIDTLNGYMQSMPDEHFLLLHIHELLTYLNQQGVVTLLITAQNGLVGPLESPIDASYLADAMLALRFFESSGRIRQAISMIKNRHGGHERSIRDWFSARKTELLSESRSLTLTACFQASFITEGNRSAC